MDNSQGKTVGELLRAAREEKKLTIEQVNRETRISVQSIRSLEGDDFGAFSSETYLKGFLRNYAEFLGLDGGKLWDMVGQRGGGGTGGGPSWDVEEALHVEKLGAPRLLKSLVFPLLLVVVIVLAVLLVRERRRSGGAQTGSAAPVEAVRPAG
ncbi:MAG: helix-turn-helix domain-containing protein [Candidatus Krumholzibacteria bacterium]|nr:helix-turn-helix domain-containing protein [Candidatus Krumholzibacteria bacterium]MDH4336646.1 helix-turn-helix domain-containing protein [Candidatus Krumholzibacteria bacterium]MDH5268989.1 helix-turn-helix domain-containing protein [Candidatus Krumholzibacteria bacterium]